MYTTATFWVRALERAVKSAAQAALLAWGAGQVDAVTLDWSTPAVLGTAALAGFGLSLLTSVASAPVGDAGTPSLVHVEPAG